MEVCLDDFWGTVCDDGWDMRDATTVCRQLGLSGIDCGRVLSSNFDLHGVDGGINSSFMHA